MTNLRLALMGFSLGSVVAGCMAPPQRADSAGGDQPKRVLRAMPKPTPPPAYAPAAAVPLDPQLQSTARQQIITSSQSNDLVLRCQAMEAAQTAGGGDGAIVILRGLDDKEPYVRFAAAMAAGTAKLSAAKPKLLSMVDQDDMNVRIGVRYALHKLGDTTHSHDFERYSTDLNPVVRRNTVMALGLIGEKSAVKILWGLQRDPDPAVRIQVAEAMWRLGEESGLKDCIGLTVSESPDIQLVGTLALAAPRDTRVKQHIRGKLTTNYDEVNLAAARAMGMIGSDDGYGVAQKGAKSSDPRQRALAAFALGAIGRADAQSSLDMLLKDGDENVRLAAAVAVLQLKPAMASSN